MDTASFIDTFAYVRWADLRQLAAAATIKDPAEYYRDRQISHGSVHKLLLHMMAGQAVWLAAWKGPEGIPDTSPAACPDLPAVQQTWPRVHEAVETYLRSLEPADLSRPVRFVRRGKEIVLPLGQTLFHTLDHATYHRGQLNTLIKFAGGTPVWCSYWIYALTLTPDQNTVTDADFC